MVFAGSSPITTTSPSSKAHQKSGPFAPPALPSLNGHTTPSDSRHGRRLRDVEAATLALDGSPPITRTTFPTCRAHYPGGSSGCACRLLPHSCSLPQMAGGSASALSLSRPAQASLTLRPAELLSRLKRPLSRGSSPASYPTKPLVSFQINRQLSGWILPPLMIRAFGAHGQEATSRGRSSGRTPPDGQKRPALRGPSTHKLSCKNPNRVVTAPAMRSRRLYAQSGGGAALSIVLSVSDIVPRFRGDSLSTH
jgi:hypothetical protein